MKKLLVAILLVALLVSPLLAEGLKEVILPSGPRVVSLYDWNHTNAFWNGLFLPVAGYKELIYLDCGFLTVIEETTPAIGLSANIPNVLSLIPGVSLKISEPVTFGYALSYNFRNGYWMSGLYLSVKL